MLLRPITTISNADGFDKSKRDALNGLIVTARNRWNEKVTQSTISSSTVKLGFTKVNGAVTAGRPYLNNHIISCHAYINGNSLPEGRWQEVIECTSNVTAFTLSGSASEQSETSLDISNYIMFKSENNKIYAMKLQDCAYTFETVITVLVE